MKNSSITNSGNDTQPYPIHQVKVMGNVIDALKVMPYPLVGNPLKGADTILIDTDGHSEQKASIAHEPRRRLKGFKPGEAGMHNIVTGNFVLMMNDGTTRLYSMKDLVMAVTENIIATFKEMSLTGETVNITANVNLTGDLTTTGNVANTGTLKNNGVNVGSTHKHSGVTVGAGNTGNPT